MKKKKDKDTLIAFSILFSGLNLLHMEKNGLVERTKKTKELNIDLPSTNLFELAKSVKVLEEVDLFVMRRIRLSTEEFNFVKKKDAEIINAFFETGLLSIGVLPHILFACLLFAYFVDSNAPRIPASFNALRNIQLYDNIFLKIEDSKIIKWDEHVHAISDILKKTIGIEY